MDRGFKAGLIALFLFVITFTIEARVVRSGPSDGLDFQTNGVNSRMEIQSSGTVDVKKRLEVSGTDDLSRPFTTLTETERDLLTPVAGDITFNETSGFLNFFNTVWRVLVDGDSAQTLTNKTMDANSNTFSNFEHGAEVDNPSSGVHGVTGSVVGTTDAQDLSNKTFVDALTLEELASTPTTPAAGDKKVYCKTDDKCYQLNDAGVEVELGAGGGGAGDVENNVKFPGFDDEQDIFTHTTGSGVVETTGGHLHTTENPSPYISLQTGTTHDHYECRSLPANGKLQYEVGCYIKSTLDDISVCFASDASTNKQCNTSYDGSDDWKYVFQRVTPQTGEQTCLRITSPSSANIGADSCRIGEPKFNTAELSNDSKPESFTPTLGGGGTYSTNTGVMFRKGKRLFVSTHATVSAAGSTTFTVTLPNNLVIDTTALPSTQTQDQIIRGTGQWFDNGTARKVLNPTYSSTTAIQFEIESSGGALSAAYFVSGDEVSVDFSVPILGWSETSTNVLAAVDKDQPSKVNVPNATAIPNTTNTFIGWGNVDFDPDNNFKNVGSGHSTTYTNTTYWEAPRSGTYEVKGRIYTTDVDLGAGEFFDLRVNVNGIQVGAELDTVQATLGGVDRNFLVDEILKLNKGDRVSLSINHNAGADVSLQPSTSRAHFSVHAVDAKALLAGLEDVSVSPALYYAGTLTSLTHNTEVKVGFDTVVTDKDSLVADPTTNWRYIVPKAGVYQVSAGLIMLSAALGTNEATFLRVWVNGSPGKYMDLRRYNGADQTTNYGLYGTVRLNLNKGDEVTIYAFQNSGSAVDTAVGAGNTFVSITKEEATLSAGSDLAPEKYAVVSHQLPTNTNAPNYPTPGAWTASTLNTEDDPENIVTLSSNQITLQPGTYIVEFFVPFIDGCAQGRGRLRNVTDGITDILGQTTYGSTAASSPDTHTSNGHKKLTIASAKTYELQHYFSGNLGCKAGLGANSGEPELYEKVIIRKLAE